MKTGLSLKPILGGGFLSWERQTIMTLQIRPAYPSDAPAMACLINDIIALGGTTAYRQAFDAEGIVNTFIAPNLGISCVVAVQGQDLVGFQTLEWCDPDWPGEDHLPNDWSIIASFVSLNVHRGGIGKAMFSRTLAIAKEAGVTAIDATIRKENTLGQAYYGGIGFEDYRSSNETVSKCVRLDNPA